MISLVHHEDVIVSALSDLIAGWGSQTRTGSGRIPKESEGGRARTSTSAVAPRSGGCAGEEGHPLNPIALAFIGITQELPRTVTVDGRWWGHGVPEPRRLTPAPAHRGAKGCSPSCKHTRGAAQGHRPAERAPSFQSPWISYPPVEKPLLVLHSCAGASGEGFP